MLKFCQSCAQDVCSTLLCFKMIAPVVTTITTLPPCSRANVLQLNVWCVCFQQHVLDCLVPCVKTTMACLSQVLHVHNRRKRGESGHHGRNQQGYCHSYRNLVTHYWFLPSLGQMIDHIGCYNLFVEDTCCGDNNQFHNAQRLLHSCWKIVIIHRERKSPLFYKIW